MVVRLYSKTQRLSGVVVKASDWRARGPGFNTLRCHLYDIIVLFLMVKSNIYIYVVSIDAFTVVILIIGEWLVWAVGGL